MTSEAISKLLDRVKTTIADLGYGAVVEDFLSRDLIG